MRVRFYAELADFLAPEHRGREFKHSYATGGTVKDLIEGLGVPHTEVDLVLVNGKPVTFVEQVKADDRVSVYPVFESLDVSSVSLVRPTPLRVTRFAVDVHLGRLASFLRLCGFDTLYRNDWQDDDLVASAVADKRILLTRDRGLLKRRAVTHGYLVRGHLPRVQLAEVLDRFDLWASLKPLSRCSSCNSSIRKVAKDLVAERVPPRTAAHYEDFWRCVGCGRVYWKGAHHQSLSGLLVPRTVGRHRKAPAGEQRDP